MSAIWGGGSRLLPRSSSSTHLRFYLVIIDGGSSSHYQVLFSVRWKRRRARGHDASLQGPNLKVVHTILPLSELSHRVTPSCVREAGKQSLVGQPCTQLKLRGSITKEDGENAYAGKWPFPTHGVSCNHGNSAQTIKVKRSLVT